MRTLSSPRSLALLISIGAAFANQAAGVPNGDLMPFDKQTAATMAAERLSFQLDDGKLSLASGDAGENGRLLIPSGSAPWNFAGQTLVTTLRNAGATPVTVRVRLENASANKLTDACQMSAVLLPGETKAIRTRAVARPEDPGYAPFKPFMMYFKNLDVRDNTVDPTTIARIVIELDRPEPKTKIELVSMTVDGEQEATHTPPPFLPFIDEFGQYIHSDWPGKIYGEKDFDGRRNEEAREREGWAGPTDWDKFGGWASGPTREATGFFRVEKVDGKWWFVDPDGKLFWSNGPTGVGFGGDITPITDREGWFKDLPARDGPWKDFYSEGRGATYMYYEHDRPWVGFDVARANLVRKYGPEYEKVVADVSHERLRSWGFNTMANWSDPAIYMQHRTPYTVAIHYGSPLIHSHMPDVYAPDWEPNVRRRLMQEQGKTAGDPWNIGYFVDNERWWGWRPRAAAVGEETLKNPPTRHAKIKFVEQLKTKYTTIEKLNPAWGTKHDSWDALLAFRDAPDMKNEAALADCGDFGMAFAERYFTVVKDAVKQAAPHQLYLGCRFHGHVDHAVVALAGKYADVVSYNIYDNPPDGRINQYRDLDLPMMATEWGVGSDPTQTPFRGEEMNIDPSTRTREITRYLEHALHHPNMIGAHFFQYRDQPISGRPDGEATLRGYVNIVDTPNFELVQTNRRIGYRLYEIRNGR